MCHGFQPRSCRTQQSGAGSRRRFRTRHDRRLPSACDVHAPSRTPASGAVGTGILGQPIVTAIAVDLQNTFEACKEFLGMYPATPVRRRQGIHRMPERGIEIDHPRRILSTPAPVIACQSPEVTGFCSAALRIKDRGRGLVYYPAICREGMKSLVDAFRCSAIRSTTGVRWNDALPTHPDRCKSRPERFRIWLCR